jgi:hypothetical protein
MAIEGKAVIPTEGACNTAVAWKVNFNLAGEVRLDFRGTRNGYDQVNELNDLSPFEKKYGKIADHGTAFEGTDGWVLVNRGLLRTYPESLMEASIPSDQQLRWSTHHVGNFLECVRSRAATVCPIEESVQADLLCQLSDIATRSGRPLRFDPRKEKFLKDSEANRKLALRPMREPWELA